MFIKENPQHLSMAEMHGRGAVIGVSNIRMSSERKEQNGGL
jgi:hypothetical protein